MGIANRRAAIALADLGISRSKLLTRDAVRETVLTITRAPIRAVLTSLGTILAVGTATAAIGLADSAAGAVSATFNATRASTVTFSASDPSSTDLVLTETAEKALDRLHGVRGAGLIWSLDDGNTFSVSRTDVPDSTGQSSVRLPVTAASAGALETIGAVVGNGRLYDAGMDHRNDAVALLGSSAASELGITSVDLSPVIFVNGRPLTVIGIIERTTLASETLLSVVVPPGIAPSLERDGAVENRQIIVRTTQGAAQLIGKQGPYAIDPYHPGQVSASVPVDSTELRQKVDSSVTALLIAVALITLGVGAVAITNTSLFSVIQRRSEIGLRRSLGAAPRHIAILIATEALFIGAIGGIIGTSAGVLVISTICALRGWIPVLAPAILFVTPAAGAAAGLVAGLYPAWRASQVTPISALQR